MRLKSSIGEGREDTGLLMIYAGDIQAEHSNISCYNKGVKVMIAESVVGREDQ